MLASPPRKLADNPVHAQVGATKGVVVRAGLQKNSEKVGVVAQGEKVAVLELARTASGSTRARTATGWLTAARKDGKQLLLTSGGTDLETLMIADLFARADLAAACCASWCGHGH